MDEILITKSAQRIIDGIRDPKRSKKIAKCLGQMEQDVHYRALQSHRYESFDAAYSEKIWESYVEQGTPGAWRIWWHFGPEPGQVTVVDLGPHPD